MSMVLKTNDKVTLCKCYICKRTYIFSLLNPIIVKQEFEESYTDIKRYVCEDCLKKLEEIQWVQISDSELKKEKKEVKENGKE